VRSPFTSLVVRASNSPGEIPSFSLDGAGVGGIIASPLGCVALEVRYLLVLSCVRRRLGVCVALGPVWMSEQRLQTSPLCRRVSTLVTWVAGSLALEGHSLGTGVSC
jgi:hypothetical protein